MLCLLIINMRQNSNAVFPENGKALNSILRVLFGTSEDKRFNDPLPSRSVSVYFPKSPGVHGKVTYRKKYSFQTFKYQ